MSFWSLNLTDQEMARALGMTGKNASDRYRKMKRGKSNISPQILEKAVNLAN